MVKRMYLDVHLATIYIMHGFDHVLSYNVCRDILSFVKLCFLKY